MAKTLEELMEGVAIEPRDLVFHAPWEARAFAIALSLCRGGNYEWEEFRRLLIAEVSSSASSASQDEYYGQFLRALERLLAAKRIVPEEELTHRMRQLAVASPAASAKSHTPTR